MEVLQQTTNYNKNYARLETLAVPSSLPADVDEDHVGIVHDVFLPVGGCQGDDVRGKEGPLGGGEGRQKKKRRRHRENGGGGDEGDDPSATAVAEAPGCREEPHGGAAAAAAFPFGVFRMGPMRFRCRGDCV